MILITGNSAFVSGNYKEAIANYTEAISIDSSVPTYFSNRAQCYIKSEQWDKALQDTQSGLELTKKLTPEISSKLFFRRALALRGLGELSAARETLIQGKSLLPDRSGHFDDELKSLSWAEKKAARNSKQRTQPKQAPQFNQTIPVQVVDTLPDKFVKSEPTDTKSKGNAVQKKSLFTPPQSVTLTSLNQLLRSTEEELPDAYRYVFNLDPKEIIAVHKTGGINYDLVDFILDAISYVMSGPSIPDNWKQQSLGLLRAIKVSPRSDIALAFSSQSKIQQALDLLIKAGLNEQETSEAKRLLS